MAQRNASKSASYRGYIPTYIDDKAKKAIRANLPTFEDMLHRLERYAEDGYRTTFSWDEYNECFSCSLFDTDKRRPSGGYILSAKHSMMHVAFATIVYLHEKVFPDGWDIEKAGVQEDVNW